MAFCGTQKFVRLVLMLVGRRVGNRDDKQKGIIAPLP